LNVHSAVSPTSNDPGTGSAVRPLSRIAAVTVTIVSIIRL
jgi:hypothetical protein